MSPVEIGDNALCALMIIAIAVVAGIYAWRRGPRR